MFTGTQFAQNNHIDHCFPPTQICRLNNIYVFCFSVHDMYLCLFQVARKFSCIQFSRLFSKKKFIHNICTKRTPFHIPGLICFFRQFWSVWTHFHFRKKRSFHQSTRTKSSTAFLKVYPANIVSFQLKINLQIKST